jgi:hypothetical protein
MFYFSQVVVGFVQSEKGTSKGEWSQEKRKTELGWLTSEEYIAEVKSWTDEKVLNFLSCIAYTGFESGFFAVARVYGLYHDWLAIRNANFDSGSFNSGEVGSGRKKDEISNIVILCLIETLLKNGRLFFDCLLVILAGALEFFQDKQRITVGYVTGLSNNSRPQKALMAALVDAPTGILYFGEPVWKRNVAKCLCGLFGLDSIILVVLRDSVLIAGMRVFCSVGVCKFFDLSVEYRKNRLMSFLLS